MKKLYILRGHSGSGKSTLANEIRKTHFNEMLNNSVLSAEDINNKIIELNNDDYIIKKHGAYIWTPKNIDEAIEENKKLFNKLIDENKKQNSNQDLIIISSNMNIKSGIVCDMATRALKNGFEVDILTCKSIFKNEHNVKDKDVVSLFLKTETESVRIKEYFNRFFEQEKNSKFKDKLFIKDIETRWLYPQNYLNKEEKEKSENYENELKQIIEKVKTFDVKNMPYDEERNTYITQDFLNYGRIHSLFIEPISKKYPDLRVLKYSQKAFYENLFNDALLEMRGLVLDKDDEIIVRPFKKIFNYSERIAKDSKFPIDIKDDHKVKLVVKLNGFLGVVTNSTKKGEILYSTTGSLDSTFAEMNKNHTEKYQQMFLDYPDKTFLFEIMDENDPHIIKEQYGEALIGIVDVKTGVMATESELDELGKLYGIRRPETIHCTFGKCKELLKTVNHEGFMVFSDENKNDFKQDQLLFKMKSPYYLISKLFGRMKNEKLEIVLDKKNIDEEYYEVVEYIKQNLDKFKQMNEQQKIDFVSDFLNENFYKQEMNLKDLKLNKTSIIKKSYKI